MSYRQIYNQLSEIDFIFGDRLIHDTNRILGSHVRVKQSKVESCNEEETGLELGVGDQRGLEAVMVRVIDQQEQSGERRLMRRQMKTKTKAKAKVES